MASPTLPQHSPLSCQYCYKYTPSLSTSVCPISYFGLSCNFDKLAKEYPDFQIALDDHLNGKQCGSDVSQQQNQSRSQQKKECSINGYDSNNDKDMPDSSSMSSINNSNTHQNTTTLSTAKRTHNFNTSLTRSLLHYHFHIQLPSLPEGHLCPPIPNRANYICWLNELLIQSQVDLYRFATTSISSSGEKEEKRSSREINNQVWHCQGIDIGTGVSVIYPLLLTTELFSGSSGDNKATSASHQQQKQWKFLATDIDPIAIQSAITNVQANHLENQIHIVQVKMKLNDETIIDVDTSQAGMKKGPLFTAMEEAKHHSAFQCSSTMSNNSVHAVSKKKEQLVQYPKFDFVMTNPPFYSTIEEIKAPRAGDKRCRTDMSTNEGVYSNSIDMDEENDNVNEGGDVGFVTAIMNDSQYFRQHVTWYTSLIAKRSSLDTLLSKLQTLDGVWGNRGQIRTVEFHQANLDTNESDRSKKKNSSNRVRWGIGWTYERAIGRCSACRVRGGLQSFDVKNSVDDNAADNTTMACDEVMSRLTSYFENLRDVSLKFSQEMRPREEDDRTTTVSEVESIDNTKNKLERCVTVVEERFHNCSPSCLSPQLDHEQDNSNLPYEGHFVIDAFVVPDNKEVGDDNKGNVSIQVILEMYSHTKHGTLILNKIRGPLQGEITRTNRRWRRFRKRQAEEA